MGLVSGYANDVFISYSHIDNQPIAGSGGWVDVFHEHLQNFIDVHVGRHTKLWRDRRLSGADVFSDEIEQQLRSSAVLVSVVSPGYLKSEWCNRELLGFAAAARNAIRVGNVQRVIKVLRLPVERSALPPMLDDVLGGHFYRVDPASGRARDLLVDASADALQVFRARVDDVAQDVSRLLGMMESSGNAPTREGAIAGTAFLAWTTGDLNETRDRLRRELEARSYRVLPAQPPPIDAAAARARVADAMRDARVAVHLFGAHYGFIPEGETRSIIEIQSDDELFLASGSAARRIFWLAPDVQAQDPRLAEFSKRLRAPLPGSAPIDVLVNQPIEALKTLLIDRLSTKPTPSIVPGAASRVYLLCDHPDRESVEPLCDYLFDRSFEVRLPLAEGDAEELRAEHYETLKESDGVLIFWGRTREGWVRTMLRDLKKVFGLGRSAPFTAASLYVAGAGDPAKTAFRTLDVSMIRGAGALDAEALHPFIVQLSKAGRA